MTREGDSLRWRVAVYLIAHAMRLWGFVTGRGIPS